jgi:hypothetical protein
VRVSDEFGKTITRRSQSRHDVRPHIPVLGDGKD